MFTEIEIAVLKNKLKLTGVARYFEVSPKYVSQILHNERRIRSEKAIQIFNYLKGQLDSESETEKPEA